MRKHYSKILTLSAALIFSTNISLADKLDIPSLDNIPPNNSEGVLRPVRTMSMDEVETQFGQPLKIFDAVGSPPITRWEYEKFIVHFEYQYVIDSVVKKNIK